MATEEEGLVVVRTESFGCIWKIMVKVGGAVAVGQVLVIVEAMKMETRILSKNSFLSFMFAHAVVICRVWKYLYVSVCVCLCVCVS